MYGAIIIWNIKKAEVLCQLLNKGHKIATLNGARIEMSSRIEKDYLEMLLSITTFPENGYAEVVEWNDLDIRGNIFC